MSFRANPNMATEADQPLVPAINLPLPKESPTMLAENFQAVNQALNDKIECSQSLTKIRASSVSSSRRAYKCFETEIHRTSPQPQTKGVISRNVNFTRTEQQADLIESNSRKSRMTSHKWLTKQAEVSSSSVGRSKNFSSRRDLKELIFID